MAVSVFRVVLLCWLLPDYFPSLIDDRFQLRMTLIFTVLSYLLSVSFKCFTVPLFLCGVQVREFWEILEGFRVRLEHSEHINVSSMVRSMEYQGWKSSNE